MRPWLVQEPSNATFGLWLPAELRWGDLCKFTDHVREATASYPWEDEPSSSGVCGVPETPGLGHLGCCKSSKHSADTPAAGEPPRCSQRHFGRDAEEAGCQKHCPVLCKRHPGVTREVGR